MILVARPWLCRRRIWVIAAMCGASFAAPRARTAPAGGLAVAAGTLDRRVPPGAAKRSQVTDRGTPATSPITVAAVFWSFARRSRRVPCRGPLGIRTVRDQGRWWTANWTANAQRPRSEEHTSELQSLRHLVCRLL